MSTTDSSKSKNPDQGHQHGLSAPDARFQLQADRMTAIESSIAALGARVTVLETPPPVITPPVADWTQVAGWRNIFHDDFADRTQALGHFMDNAVDLGTGVGWRTADSRYLVRRYEWKDTSGHGTRGDGAIVEVANGQMLQHPYTDASGFGHNCIMGPLAAGSTVMGDLVGGRFAIRLRGSALVGHKCVPLWWPTSTGGTGSPNFGGEIDKAEASWNKTPKLYLHSADGYSSGHQAYGVYPAGTSLQDFHEYASEWIPGVSVTYLLDGVVVAKFLEGQVVSGFTMHIPTSPMHPVMQFETATDPGDLPVANTSGLIEIDRVGVWALAA